MILRGHLRCRTLRKQVHIFFKSTKIVFYKMKILNPSINIVGNRFEAYRSGRWGSIWWNCVRRSTLHSTCYRNPLASHRTPSFYSSRITAWRNWGFKKNFFFLKLHMKTLNIHNCLFLWSHKDHHMVPIMLLCTSRVHGWTTLIHHRASGLSQHGRSSHVMRSTHVWRGHMHGWPLVRWRASYITTAAGTHRHTRIWLI